MPPPPPSSFLHFEPKAEAVSSSAVPAAGLTAAGPLKGPQASFRLQLTC